MSLVDLPRGDLLDEEVTTKAMTSNKKEQSYKLDAEDPKKSMTSQKKAAIAAATVVGLGALGVAGYVYREELKNFFNWNKLANGAVESSADLLVAKLSLALSLCDIEPVDIEAVKRALTAAKKEAQSVASINKQLQGRLDKIVSAQPAEEDT